MINSLIQECSLEVFLVLKDNLYSLVGDILHYLAKVKFIPVSLLKV